MTPDEQRHSFPPAAHGDARVLILGSMPGAESLRRQQYYAFPGNAFWRIMGTLFGFDPALPYSARLEELNRHGAALWDVLKTCRREGSLDQKIRQEEANDIPEFLSGHPQVQAIFCNGSAAFGFLKRHHPELFNRPGLHIEKMPSTSPAAARLDFAAKLAAYRAIADAVRPQSKG